MSTENQPTTSTSPKGTLLSRTCVTCRYDLRGTATSAKCPECGTPVEDSLRGFLFCYAPAHYRRRVERGLSIMLPLIFSQILLLVLSLVSLLRVNDSFGITTQQASQDDQMLFWVACVGCLLAGFIFAAPPVGFAPAEVQASGRGVLRLVTLFAIVPVCIVLGFSSVVSRGELRFAAAGDLGWYFEFMYAASLFSQILLCVHVWATCRYSAWLFFRVADTQGERRAKLFSWLLPGIALAGFVAGLVPVLELLVNIGFVQGAPQVWGAASMPRWAVLLVPVFGHSTLIATFFLLVLLLWRLRLRMAEVRGANPSASALA
jgi:hypothetical protein